MVEKMESTLGKKSTSLNKSLFVAFTNLFERKGDSRKQLLVLAHYLHQEDANGESKSQYVINRLVRALGSARVHTQAASFSALVSLLNNSNVVTVDEILSAADKELEKINSSSKSEEAEVNIGNVLLYGVLLRSPQILPISDTKDVLGRLLSLDRSKTYLSFLTFCFVVDFVKTVDAEYFNEAVWPIVSQHISSDWEYQSLDTLFFIFATCNRFPKFLSKLKKHCGSFEQSSNYICNTLLTAQGIGNLEHPVFEEFCKLICSSEELLLKFWTFEIENQLIKVTYNKEQRVIAMFSYLIQHVQSSFLPQLLTPKFISVLINILSFKKDKGKHSGNDIRVRGEKVLYDVINILSKDDVDDEVRVDTIKKLMFYPGHLKFEQKTGSRCIQLITLQCGIYGVKTLADIYSQIINGCLAKVVNESGKIEPWHNKEKIYILSIYRKLINHLSMKEEKDWKVDQIKFLFLLAFVKNSRITNDVQKFAKDCFYYSLNLHFSKLDQLIDALEEVTQFVQTCFNDDKLYIDEESMEAWQKMMSFVGKLTKGKRRDGSFKVLCLLLLHMGLQLLNDKNLAIDNLDELFLCYKHIKDSHKILDENETAEDPHWTEVTVDLFLSLLSRENKLWRHVIACTFPHLCQQITATGLQQIIEALDPNSEKNPLSEDVVPESELSSGDEDKDKDEDAESDNESAVDESSEEEIEETVNDKLRVAVRDALGCSAALTDDESEDMDNMDEEEEERLNIRLGEAFKLLKKLHKGNRKKQSKSEAALMHFRLRVLDLIEIYVTHRPSLIGCLEIIPPLFTLLETSIKDYLQKPLQNRLDSILRKVTNVKKFPSTDYVHKEMLLNIFRSLVDRGDTTSLVYSEMSPRISDTCTFLIRCSQQLPPTKMKKSKKHDKDSTLDGQYASLLHSYFKTRDCRLPASLFQAVLRMAWSGNWSLVAVLFDVISDQKIHLFKRNKAVELLQIFYQNNKLLCAASDEQNKSLHELEECFISKIVQTLVAIKEKNGVITQIIQSFVCNVMKFINLAHKTWLQHRKSSFSMPEWSKVLSVIADSELIGKRMTNAVKKIFNSLGVTLTPLSIEKKKSKLKYSEHETDSTVNNEANINGNQSAADNDEKVKRKKKKKKKSSVATMILKKESKKLRSDIHSLGLNFIKFSELEESEIPPPDDSENLSGEQELELPKRDNLEIVRKRKTSESKNERHNAEKISEPKSKKKKIKSQ